jgi:uroporphyrinogen decarboxylase
VPLIFPTYFVAGKEDNMIGRERILTTLNHKEPDTIPLDIGGGNACGISIVAYRRLLQIIKLPVRPKVREFAEQLAWMDEEMCVYLGVDTRRLTLPAEGVLFLC